MSIRSMLALSTLPVMLAGLVLSAHAQSQPSPTTTQPLAAKDKQIVESAFTKADADTNGKLSKQEAGKLPAISAKFDTLDKDKDGALSLDEFTGAFSSN